MLQEKLEQPVSAPPSPRDISKGDTAANLTLHVQHLKSEVDKLKMQLLNFQKEHSEKMAQFALEKKQIRDENIRLQKRLQMEVERQQALCRHLSESKSSPEMDEERQIELSSNSSSVPSPISTHSGMSSNYYTYDSDTEEEERKKRIDEALEELDRNFPKFSFLYSESDDDNADDFQNEPVTAKEKSCANEIFKYSCSVGWTTTNMEDAHTHLLSLAEDKEASFFAVYDGHGGAKVAEYAGNNLHKMIASHPAYRKGDIVAAIKASFLEVDSDMLKDDNMSDGSVGTTAVVALIKNGKIYCSNVGDSRAVASVAGQVQQLSFDHKPSNETEIKLIPAARGWFECIIVNAYPDVIVKDLTSDHEFLVLAGDSMWHVMTDDEVVDFVRTRIASRMEPEQICKELTTHCDALHCEMSGLGCSNVTVILVCFLQGDTYEELANKCSRVLTSTTDDNIIMSESSASDADDDCLEDTRPLQDIYQCGPAARDSSVSANRQTAVSTENPPCAQMFKSLIVTFYFSYLHQILMKNVVDF